MSYYPPKGKELKALRKIRKLVPMIISAQDNFNLYASSFMEDPGTDDSFSWQRDTDFALRGVSTNVTDRTTTIASIILAVHRMRAKRPVLGRKIEREIRKLNSLLSQVERVIEPFGLCPSCLGNRGRYLPVTNKRQVKKWEDCCFCEGRGVLL